jgi:methyltransferase
MRLSILILAFVTLQRSLEFALAERNTRRLLARGGFEAGAEHYPILVGLHAAWLAGLWWWGWNRPTDLAWLALYAVVDGLRLWTLATLGPRWTARIIVLPGEPLVRRGPYRFFRHPNYALVAAQVAVLPLVFHLYAHALVFSLLNASIAWVRIMAERDALRPPREI